MVQQKENFYLSKDEPQRSCLLSLRHIILKQDEFITETVKYGMPCFQYKTKLFCYLWTDKKTEEPYILFVEGKHLEDSNLEKGSRAKMKIYRVNPKKDLPLKTIVQLLSEALNLYKTGVVKVK